MQFKHRMTELGAVPAFITRKGKDGARKNKSASLHRDQASFHRQIHTGSNDKAVAFKAQCDSTEKQHEGNIKEVSLSN